MNPISSECKKATKKCKKQPVISGQRNASWQIDHSASRKKKHEIEIGDKNTPFSIKLK